MPDIPIINLRGNLVGLGPLRADLLPLYTRWMNDFEVTKTLTVGNRPLTAEFENDWYQRVSRSDDRVFVIYELESERPIGTAGLHQIDLRNRTSEFGIVIGERDAWGKGFGTEATRLCVGHGFQALNLHSVYLRAYAENPAALKAYQRCGFKLIGRRREAIFTGGAPQDVVYMDCLATEFVDGAAVTRSGTRAAAKKK